MSATEREQQQPVADLSSGPPATTDGDAAAGPLGAPLETLSGQPIPLDQLPDGPLRQALVSGEYAWLDTHSGEQPATVTFRSSPSPDGQPRAPIVSWASPLASAPSPFYEAAAVPFDELVASSHEQRSDVDAGSNAASRSMASGHMADSAGSGGDEAASGGGKAAATAAGVAAPAPTAVIAEAQPDKFAAATQGPERSYGVWDAAAAGKEHPSLRAGSASSRMGGASDSVSSW